jgi:hypothetical protein
MSASRAAALVGVLALVAGCGGQARAPAPTVDRTAVAKRFASAIFRGDVGTAVALLDSRQALSASVRRAAARWGPHHGRERLVAKQPAGRFVFAFSGTHPHPDGRFEIERGELVVVVGPTLVEAFTFRNTVTKFKTHHDSQLLPSDR